MSLPPARRPFRIRSRCLLGMARARSRLVSSGISSMEARFFVVFIKASLCLRRHPSADDSQLIVVRLRVDHHEKPAAYRPDRDESILMHRMHVVVEPEETAFTCKKLRRFLERHVVL